MHTQKAALRDAQQLLQAAQAFVVPPAPGTDASTALLRQFTQGNQEEHVHTAASAQSVDASAVTEAAHEATEERNVILSSAHRLAEMALQQQGQQQQQQSNLSGTIGQQQRQQQQQRVQPPPVMLSVDLEW